MHVTNPVHSSDHALYSTHSVLVLDELDQLSVHCQHILYTVFEWPALSRSRLILIGQLVSVTTPTHYCVSTAGIANALDLTDRMLPRLQAHVQGISILSPPTIYYLMLPLTQYAQSSYTILHIIKTSWQQYCSVVSQLVA